MDVFVFCECCVLSGRVLCVGPITCPQQYSRLWCVVASEFESLSQHSHGGTVENRETISQDSLSASRNSTWDFRNKCIIELKGTGSGHIKVPGHAA
jgi:hypothetical protein